LKALRERLMEISAEPSQLKHDGFSQTHCEMIRGPVAHGNAGSIDEIGFTNCAKQAPRVVTAVPHELPSVIITRPTYRTG
jgi:hypothetical protein